MRVFLAGGTGTAGRATARALVEAGHQVTCLARRTEGLPPGVETVIGQVSEPETLSQVLRSAPFEAVVSCLTSRTGIPREAWAIDHAAQVALLEAAQTHGIPRFLSLSAICVQRPKLAFQRAKLAFEERLIGSGLTYSIVRPTAFFKSLSGQAQRVAAGKPFLVFGDGTLTACTPISDGDLGHYMAQVLTDPASANQILPIGGPGPALTPLDQGRALAMAFGRPPLFRKVPVALMDTIIGVSSLAGRVSAAWADRAERARIGRYYATESMLLLDPNTGAYDRGLTPSFGTERLEDHYQRLARGEISADIGDHAMF